jgi:mono/diheme cytochrome c family protein
MKRTVVVSLTAIFLILSSASWAADGGAALFKSKCAGCHGATGEGKAALKAPALKGTSFDSSQNCSTYNQRRIDQQATSQ